MSNVIIVVYSTSARGHDHRHTRNHAAQGSRIGFVKLHRFLRSRPDFNETMPCSPSNFIVLAPSTTTIELSVVVGCSGLIFKGVVLEISM